MPTLLSLRSPAGTPAPKRAMPKNPTQAQRLEQAEFEIRDLKAQLAQLATAEEIAAMRDDVAVLTAELRARGVEPRLPNPAVGRAKLPPETVSAIRSNNAATARASKEVGRGQGKVRTKATQTKLKRRASKRSKKKAKKP